ncbi:hypothetical protein ABLE93_08700 [Xanthobacter sp. KR7-65]|uniref:hypothetical protein n=1 Tax=Xanthobacter sp. KR7-65 TaxID=3156612 RepID=UPI0032B34763
MSANTATTCSISPVSRSATGVTVADSQMSSPDLPRSSTSSDRAARWRRASATRSAKALVLERWASRSVNSWSSVTLSGPPKISRKALLT